MPENERKIKVIPQANAKTSKTEKEPKSKQIKGKLKSVDDPKNQENSKKKSRQNAQ
jgi:hypothetical protein